MAETTDLAAASDGELAAVAQRIQAERIRRQGEDQAERQRRQQQELAEIDRGERLPTDEHLALIDHHKTTEWLETGKLAHLGLGQSKRRGRR